MCHVDALITGPFSTALTIPIQTAVMVRNVRQAHECLEHGETLLFRDEVDYLLDNMRPSQPLLVRCLR